MEGSSIQLSKSYDPRMLFAEKRSFNVVTGIANILQQKNVSTSYSGSNVVHALTIPQNTVLDRRINMRWYVQLTITGTSPNPLLQLGTNDGIRANPISAMITSLTAQIGNTNVSTQPFDYIQQLTRYEKPDDQSTWYSMSPSYPDQFQTYSDYSVYGVARNPLALYGSNDYQIPRGGHPITVVSDDGSTAIVRFVVNEPLRLSPFNWLDTDAPGLVGVQTLNINATLGDFSRMWSHAYSGTYAITGITGSFYAPPELDYQVISPDISVGINKQRPYLYPYQEITRYVTTGPSLAKGASSTVSTNTVQLNAVPSRVYIYARQQNSDLLGSSPWLNSDSCANITACSITFNNNNSLLAAASEYQLYAMSVKNGLQMSWPQWKKYCGSVLCVEFGSDLGLQNLGLAPGTGGSFQLQANVTFNNPITTSNTTPATTITYAVYVVVIQDGSLVSSNGTFSTAIGILNNENVIAAIKNEDIPYVPFNRMKSIYGNGFFDSVGNFFSDVYHKGIKPLGEAALSAVAPGIEKFGNSFVPGLGTVARGFTGHGVTGGDILTGGGAKKRGRPPGSKNKPKKLSEHLSGGKLPQNIHELAKLLMN